MLIGGVQHLPQQWPGHAAAHCQVQVRGQPFLRFHAAAVLRFIAEDPAQVLDEPVKQRGEMDRVPGRPGVVVASRVSWVPSSLTLP